MRLPRTLRSLGVYFGKRDDESYNAGLYILSAVSQTPSLENLYLDGMVHPMILVHVASFSSLRCLDLKEVKLAPSLNPLIQDGFRALLGIGTLLKLDLPRVLDVDHIPGGVVSHSLRAIDICGDALLFRRVISILSSTAIHTVIIHALNTNPTADEMSLLASEQWRASLDQLRARCGASLRCIAFSSRSDLHLSQLIKPLLEMRYLEEFRTSGVLSLSREDVTAMATAWPNIRSLKLDSEITRPRGDNVSNPDSSTVHCLVTFARFCPKLRILHMRFDDNRVPSTLNFPYLSHPLQELHLFMPHLRDYVQMAALADRIFPTLSNIYVEGGFSTRVIQDWVPQTIRALQAVRNEQRPPKSEL